MTCELWWAFLGAAIAISVAPGTAALSLAEQMNHPEGGRISWCCAVGPQRCSAIDLDEEAVMPVIRCG